MFEVGFTEIILILGIALVVLGHGVLAQRREALQRVRQRGHAGGVDRGKLVDQAEDRGELGVDVGRLLGSDVEAGEVGGRADVHAIHVDLQQPRRFDFKAQETGV